MLFLNIFLVSKNFWWIYLFKERWKIIEDVKKGFDVYK